MKLPADLGERIADLTFAEADSCRGATGGKCTRAELRPRIAAAVMVLLGQVLKEQAAAKPRARKPYVQMSEVEFLAFLEAEPTLKGVDIRKEIGKCTFWCRVNSKLPTRKRIINWLNKADRELVFTGTGHTSRPAPAAQAPGAEPIGWRQWLNQHRPDSKFSTGGTDENTPWARLEKTARDYIIAEMKASGANLNPVPAVTATQEDF